jgi:hypothetical protein
MLSKPLMDRHNRLECGSSRQIADDHHNHTEQKHKNGYPVNSMPQTQINVLFFALKERQGVQITEDFFKYHRLVILTVVTLDLKYHRP